MKKIFLLDTNVLLYDPNSLFVFADNEVVLPLSVIEEIDNQKKRMDDVGRNSRQVARLLDKLRGKDFLLSEGVKLDNGGLLRVEMLCPHPSETLPLGLEPGKVDNQILSLAVHLNKTKNVPVVLVTKDITLRIKADAVGLSSQDYECNKVNVEELYSGTTIIEIEQDLFDRFYKEGRLKLEDGLLPNQGVTLIDKTNPNHCALGIYCCKEDAVLRLKRGEELFWGIKGRNREQKFALDLLLNDDISLVSLVGIAGTGKTLLAIAAGLTKVITEKQYQKLLITRPIVSVGSDLGFLPGDIKAKLLPRMQPIADNLEFLFNLSKKPLTLEQLIDAGTIELEALPYIRGRSIPHQFIVVDEVQNLTPHEIKTIITRAGVGTKIIITGDYYQIDNPYLDASSNGLTYLVERFKGQEMFGHITFIKGERSPLADLAAKVL